MLSNHLIISAPFSFDLQSFPASESFSVSQLLASGDQIIGASASVSVLPVNIQGWFPLGLTGLILLSKGLWRVFSAPVRKHQFFGAQPSLWSNSHIPTWLLEKPWCVCVSHSVVSNSVTPWAVTHQAPPNQSISKGGYMCLDGQDLQNCIYLAPNLKELLECRCHRKGGGIHRK